MSGDAGKIMRLWEVKTGLAQPDNLDDNFAVQLGVYTEAFNREWFYRLTGMPVISAGDFRVSRDHPFMQVNLDGEVLLVNSSAVFEAKHTGSHMGMKGALATYQPQLHHAMMVCGYRKAYLSVIVGNSYDYVEVDFDAEYAAALLKVEQDFWECVTLKMPPGDIPVVVPPPEATRVLDMTGSNEWAAHAADWIATRTASATFEAASKGLRSLVPADARSCSGHGIRIDRDKRRALRIRQDRDDE